jgi:subtilisin family serine protease/glucose/arabinose dehydrogenase
MSLDAAGIRPVTPSALPRATTLLALLVLAPAVALVARDAAASTSTPRAAFVAPEVRDALAADDVAPVLVTLRAPPALAGEPVDIPRLRTQVTALQATVLSAVPQPDFAVTYRYQAVPALAGRVSAKGLEALEAHPAVAEVTRDGIGRTATAQSLPLIHAPEVHATGLTGEGVVVAVLDSGIDWDHPDLADSVAYERCFLSQGGCPPEPHVADDDNGHGTNVSGIITSNGTVAPLGVAPGARIAAYKVLRDTGLGFFSDWVAALDDIIANHPEVDLVNMSLQSGAMCPAGALRASVDMLRQLGVATFISSGNHGMKNAFPIPACIASALTVGATYDADVGAVNGWKVDCTDATTRVDQVACWSNSDEALDLLAPGDRIRSTGAGGGASSYHGTSQASPHAAGVAALVLQAFPDMGIDELELRLEATGTLVSDPLGDGDPATNRARPRIDARAALLHSFDDTDGDGCANAEEFGTDLAAGGRRNPLNPYDFYDTNGDGVVNLLDDVLAVVAAVGPASGPNYRPELDRSPAVPGADPWQLGPPDGKITFEDDVLAVLAQFGHRCDGVPPAEAGMTGHDRGRLNFATVMPTSLAFGPDGRLYVASLTEIVALTLDPATKAVLAEEQIASGLDDVLGIAFDPTAPAPVAVYASRRDTSLTDGFESVISRFVAPDWHREDVITGLPTSRPYLNHATNGLAFDNEGRLFIAQGSATDAGVADPPGNDFFWPETPLSAAILVADIHAPGFNGTLIYDPPGPPASDDVELVSGDVAIYAFGTRNPYDLVLHSNGLIYATDNGAYGAVYSSSCTEETSGVSVSDELNLIEEGNYYGHPNRNRGRTDPRQCVYRLPEDGDGNGATGPIELLPGHCSCDGMVEYTGPAVGRVAPGDLLYVGWVSDVLFRARLSANGRAVAEVTVVETDFASPLDVTVGPDGTIYIAEFGDGTIAYLQPEGLPPTPTPTSTAPAVVTPTRTPTPTATPPQLRGDVNCDGGVTAIDAALVLQLVAGLIDTLACADAADANGDARVTAVDAALILQRVAGLIDSLPP